MCAELQQRFEFDLPCDTIEQLKKMFQEQARVDRYNVIKGLVNCRLAEGGSVTGHMFKMTGYLQQLDKLDIPLPREIAQDLVLNSLPPSYSGFILNYHMHGMDKSLDELHGMLKTAEVDMKKGKSHVLAIRDGSKKVGKGKAKGKG